MLPPESLQQNILHTKVPNRGDRFENKQEHSQGLMCNVNIPTSFVRYLP